MVSRSAVAKLKAVLLIDLVIVAVAAGAYFYLQSQGLIAFAPLDAVFAVANLRINPAEAEIFEPITVSVNLTNHGDLEGTYMANLTLNGNPEDNQTIVLPGRNSTLVEFTLIKEVPGNYSVELGGLKGSFTLKPPSQSSNVGLSKLVVTPYESWPNNTITASVTATNIGAEAGNFTLRLMIDDAFVEARKISLAVGESVNVDFQFNATTEGKHTLKINTLSGSFMVVKTGYHTLTVNRSGGGSTPLPFTLNGEPHQTAYTELLPVGEYTLSVPTPFTTATAVLEFAYWSDGVTTPTRTINLQNRLIIVATYNLISGYASCPSLYFWNGTAYVYTTDVSNAGWLGYIDHIHDDGSIVFGGGNPWDYVKLDGSQLAVRVAVDGTSYYDLVLFQQWNELFYLDKAYMVVVDHPAGTDVYSTMSNYVNKGFNGQIYTVDKNNLLAPVAATNEKGEDVLPQIMQIDRVFTPGNNGLLSPSWNNLTLNQLTVDLGDLSSAQRIKLVLNGMVDWGQPEPYYAWIKGFQEAFAQGLVPPGTQVYPPPSMEIKDASGNWVRVPQNRQIPTPSDFTSRSFVVDLTGLFPAGATDYQIRITNFFNVTFDYIGIDTSPQETTKTTEIYPSIASLNPLEFGNLTTTSSGRFTKYGDVTPLLLEADDMFVIGRQGDSVSLQFPTTNLPPLAEGMERDYFFFVAAWFKDPPDNWGYGFNYTVEPLPFMNMTGFPYPVSTESYPFDAEHLAYLSQWNTRLIPPL